MVVSGQVDSFYAGNTRTIRYTITDEDVDGSPAKDITGYTVKWALARFNANGDYLTTPVLEKHSSDSSQVAIVDGPNGIVEVYLLHADTVALSGDFYSELEVFDLSSNSEVVATATHTINKNVVNT